MIIDTPTTQKEFLQHLMVSRA